MWITLALTGSILGLVVAFATHAAFVRLRRRAPKPVAVAGWLLAAFTLYLAGSAIACAILAPSAPMAGPLLTMGALFAVLLLVCALLGRVHRVTYQMTLSQAFGVLVTEAWVALGAAFVMHAMQYVIASLLPSGNPEVGPILESFAQARFLLGCFDVALLVTLIAVERLRSIPPR
jgi:hypothetical protein